MAHNRETVSEKFPLGSKLPSFELPATDGRNLGSAYLSGAKAQLVVFTCNHCPYVKGSEFMLSQIVRKFEREGLKTLAISSNDAAQYPDDSFEKMKEKSQQLGNLWPYLYDESQAVAKKFDAACTPECYLFNSTGTLVFHGTINDSPRDSSKVQADYLSPAISQVLAGIPPQPAFVHPIGCSIKWKAG